MNIKVLVAIHKKFWVPESDMYLPIHVGSTLSKKDLGFQRDDEGDNISEKNGKYCELTGVYWAWKNLDADYIGLVHYRRYMSLKGKSYRFKRNRKDKILNLEEIEKLFRTTDVIVPKKRFYFIETLYSHYAHTHDGKHLDITRTILEENYPEYLGVFDQIMNRRSAHMFNMFVMKKCYFGEYCQWMFSVLEELEQRIDTKGMTAFEARFLGRIGELLLDVWLEQNNISFKEVGYVQLGKINWPKKICSFLKAKYRNEKYSQSV